jgi:hypothetical protein
MKIAGGVFAVLFSFLFWISGTALLALIGKLLFNFIAVETHHPTAQISFWVAMAAVILLRIVGSCFSSGSK